MFILYLVAREDLFARDIFEGFGIILNAIVGAVQSDEFLFGYSLNEFSELLFGSFSTKLSVRVSDFFLFFRRKLDSHLFVTVFKK